MEAEVFRGMDAELLDAVLNSRAKIVGKMAVHRFPSSRCGTRQEDRNSCPPIDVDMAADTECSLSPAKQRLRLTWTALPIQSRTQL